MTRPMIPEQALQRSPKPFKVPIGLLGGALTPLEALVKYLKEEKLLTLAMIAQLTNRDPRCIGITYRRAKNKYPMPFEMPERATIKFPIALLRDGTLSPAEHVVRHLKEEKLLSLSQIAKLLDRDERTIWTLYDRAKKKLEK